MNIGCDLDGVIIDHSYNQALMLTERGFVIPRAEITKEILTKLLAPQEYQAFKQELYDVRGANAQEIPGAFDALSHIASRGHRVRIISRRDKTGAQAVEWLGAHGFLACIPPERIHFVRTYEEKEDICRQYGVQLHIDDSPELFDCLKTPPYRVLFDPFFRRHHKPSVVLAHTWDHILAHVHRLDR